MSDEEKEPVECAVCNKFEAQAWRRTLCKNCFHTLSEHSTESGLPADVKKEKDAGKERARTPDKGDKVIGKENKPMGKDTGKKDITKSPSIEKIDKLGENVTGDKNIQDYSKSKQPLGSNKDISGKFRDEKESTVSSNADNSKNKETFGKQDILTSKLESKNEIAERKDKILNKFGLKPVRDESKTTNLKSKFESTSFTMPSSLGELDRKYKTDNGLKGNKTDTQPSVCDKKDTKTERKPAISDNKLESKLSLKTTESKGESKVESKSLKIDRKTDEKAKMDSKSEKIKDSELTAAPKSLQSPENSPSADLRDRKSDWRSALKKKKEEKETETSRQSPPDGTTDKTQSWKQGLRSKAGGDDKGDSSSATSPSVEKSDVKPSWKATKQKEAKSSAKSPSADNLDKARDLKSAIKSKEVESERKIGQESSDIAVESTKSIKDDKKEMKLQNKLEDKQKSDSEKRKDKIDTKAKISEKIGKEPDWKRGLKKRTEDKDARNAVLTTSNDTVDKKPDWRSALKKGADKKDTKLETQSTHESEVKKKLEESVDKITSQDEIQVDRKIQGVSRLGSKLASENETENISKAEAVSLISKSTTTGPRAAEESTGILSNQNDASSPHIDNKPCWAIDVATPSESDTRAVGGSIEAQSTDITFCSVLLDTSDQSLGASTQVFTNSKIAAAEAAAIFVSSDNKTTNKSDAYRSGLSLPLQSLVTDLGQTKSKESLKSKNVAVDESGSKARQVLSPGQRSPVDIDRDFEKLREDLLEMAEKCRHLEQENEALRKGIRHEGTHDLAKQKQELEGSIKALQEQLKSMEGRCVKLETDNNTLIGSIRADQEKSREHSPSRHSADLGNLLTERERMCCELIEENDELKQEIQDIKVEMDEMYDTFRDQEVEEFRELQKELEITAKNCRILQFKLRKAERRNEQIESDRQQYEERLRKLQSQFESEDARAHIQTLEEELKMAKDVSVRLHDELDMVDDKRTKIEEENRHLTDLLEQADRKQFRLEMEVDKLRDQIAELRIELSKTSGNVSEEDVKAARKEASTVARQSSQVADLQQLKKDIYDSLERERDLKDQLQFALEEAKMFRKKMADLEEENDNLSRHLKRLSTQKANKDKSGSENGTEVEGGEMFESKVELELQFELAEQELAVIKRRLSAMENENESLFTTISDLKQELKLKEEALQIKPKPSSPNDYYEDVLRDKDRELDVLRWKVIEKERDIERLHIQMSSIQTRKGDLRKSKSLDYEYNHMVDLKRQLELTQQESMVLRDRVMLLEGENENLSMEVHKLSLKHSEEKHVLQGLAVAYVESEDDVQLHDKINSLERERECYIAKLADLAKKFTSLTKEHDRSKIRPASTSVIGYLDLISTYNAGCEPEGIVSESICTQKVETSHDSVEIVDTGVKSRDPEQLLNVIDERFSFVLQQVISARRPDNMEESHEPCVSAETKAAEISGSVTDLEQVTDIPPKAETSFDTYSDFNKIQLIEKILDMEEDIEDLRLIVKSKDEKNQSLEEEVRVLDKQLDDLRGEYHRKEMELLTDLDMISDKNEILSNLLDIVKDRAEAAEQELERLAREEREVCNQEPTTLKSRSPSTLSGVSTGSDEVFDLGSSSERSQDQFKKRIASLECLLAEERKKTATLEKRLMLAGNEALPSMSDDLKLHLREKELLKIELQESRKNIKIANEEVHALSEKLQKLEADFRKERSDTGSASLTPETKTAEIEKLQRECTEYKLKVADLECQVKELNEIWVSKSDASENEKRTIEQKFKSKAEDLLKVEEALKKMAGEDRRKDSVLREKESLIKRKEEIIQEQEDIIKQREDDMQSLLDQISQREKAIRELNETLRSRDERLKEKDDILQKLNTGLDEKTEELHFLEDEIKNMSAKSKENMELISRLKETLSKNDSDKKTEIETENIRLNSDIENLMTNIEKMHSDNFTLQTELDKSKQALSEAMLMWDRDRSTLSAELNIAREKCRIFESTAGKKESQAVSLLRKETHHILEQKERLANELRMARIQSDADMRQLKSERFKLQQELTSKIRMLTKEITDNDKMSDELNQLRRQDEMTYQLQQHEKILRAEYMAMKVRYETQLETLQKEHLQLLVVVDRLQREKHLDKDIIVGVQKGMSSIKQTYSKDLSRWTDEKNILQRHIQEIEEGKEIANHLKSQVEELKRKLAEQELERAELINKMTTERTGWDIKWAQITSRNNQIEEALALMAQSKCKSQDIQHRVESTWEKERAEQKRLLMEAHDLAIDLQKQLEERDQAFAEERRKLLVEIEAHRKQYDTEKADKEKKSLVAQTNESTIKHLTATIEEMKDKHKKEQDSWMKEKAELLRRLAEIRRAYSRERRNVENVLTGLKKLRELSSIVVESESSDPSAPHCVERRIGVTDVDGAESASAAATDTVVLSDVKHNIDQVILKYVKESLRQIHFAAERLSRPEEYKDEEKKILRRSLSSSELELLKDEFLLEEPADSRSIYTYHEVIEDLSPYSTSTQVADCTTKKVQYQQSVSAGSLQSNHIDMVVNEQSSSITDGKSTRTMQQLFAHKLNKPLTSCIIPEFKSRTPSPKPQEHALSAKPTITKSISVDVSHLNRLSAPPYGSSNEPVSLTTTAFVHYNTAFIPRASSGHLKGESDISNLGTPKIGSLDRLSPQAARRKFFEEKSPESVTYLSLPERYHRSAALKTRQNLSDLTVVKGSDSDISPAFLSEPLPCIRQTVSLDDNSLHSVIATSSQESLSVLSSERRTASAKEKRNVFRKSQSMDSSPVKSTLARIGINVMSAGAPSGFSPSDVFAALKKKLKPSLKRSQSARETSLTKMVSKAESVPTSALVSRAEIHELMVPIDIPDKRDEIIPSPSFAESSWRNDTSSHKSASTAVSPVSVTTSSQSKAPKLKKRSKSVETSPESYGTHPIIVPRSTPSGTEWFFSETRV
ncbi:hypothetical protein CHS0354_032188 [Potamilus streckersoni]|uniref:SOGA coiled-coil domain-containing protein n=1 Tax=Potamilus streckersoni TaxID=2493646 RepID=A0AAE0WCC1_9BIVA|nr:hypothetical protein CHS0354_032188 [Potamilus streckersoni]